MNSPAEFSRTTQILQVTNVRKYCIGYELFLVFEVQVFICSKASIRQNFCNIKTLYHRKTVLPLTFFYREVLHLTLNEYGCNCSSDHKLTISHLLTVKEFFKDWYHRWLNSEWFVLLCCRNFGNSHYFLLTFCDNILGCLEGKDFSSQEVIWFHLPIHLHIIFQLKTLF